MSYILDALERSEQERKQGELPSFRQDQSLLCMRKERRSPWLMVVSGVLLLNAMVLLYIYYLNSDASADLSPAPSKTDFPVQGDLSSQQQNNAEARQLSAVVNKPRETAAPAPVVAPPVTVNNALQERVQQQASLSQASIVRETALQVIASQKTVSQATTPQATTPQATTPQATTPQATTPQATTPQTKTGEAQALSVVARPDLSSDADNIEFERIDPAGYQGTEQSAQVEEEVKLSPLVVVSDVPLNVDGDTRQTSSELRENYDSVAYLSELSASSRPRVPKLIFNSHIYSSEPSARRVMINNIYLREGQVFQGMTLLAIDEEFVVIEQQGQQFKLPVMRDWLG